MGQYRFSVLTLKDLDRLQESYRAGSMLFGSDEHDQFIEDAIHYMPRLIYIARESLKPKRKRAKVKK